MTQGAIRFFSVKDGWEGKKASLLAGGLMAVGCFVWFIPPMVGRLLYNEQILASSSDPAKAAESAYAITSFNVLPLGLTGVMVVAMFAATISSMDTGLNRNAALIVRDIIPALLRVFKLRRIPHTAEVVISRVVTVVMGASIICLALMYSRLKGTDIFEIALNFMAIILIPTSVPMLLAFLIKRTASWAAASSILLGFLPSFFQLVSGVDWTFQQRTGLITTGAILGFLIAMPFYKRSPQEYRDRVDGFFRKMHTPVDFDKEIGVSNDGIQMLIIGRYALVLGIFLTLIIFVPNPLWARLSVLAVSGSVILVGGVLLFFGKRRHAVEKASLDAVIEEEEAKS
jgi:Na+/proline symporter